MTGQEAILILLIWTILGAVFFIHEMDGPWRGPRFWTFFVIGGPCMWLLVVFLTFSEWAERFRRRWKR